MKPDAILVNVARGSLVDHDALIASLGSGELAGAILEVTDPEPLPPDNLLWALPNVLITMHLSARTRTGLQADAVARFLKNLERYQHGEPLLHTANLNLGY
jgi:phosphoglycerate dehydrogenase-like enzyme